MPFGSILGGVAGPLIGGALGGVLGSSQQGANTSTQSGNYNQTGPFSPLLPSGISEIGAFLNRAPSSAAITALQQALINNSSINAYDPIAHQAENLATSAGGVASPISQFATNAATPITGGDISNYLNPFTQDVANQASTLAGRFLTEQALPAVGDTFTMAGQPGSSRQADFDTRAIRDTTTNLQGELGSILGGGFNTALSAAQQDKSRQLGAANALLGGAQAQLGASGALQNIGNANISNLQNIGQLGLNTAQATGQGTGAGQSTGSFTGPSPSVLGSILGGALSGNSMLSNLGLGGLFTGGGDLANGGISSAFQGVGAAPYKDGGPVRRKRPVRGALSAMA